ncbi:hypothetical protein BGZ68_010295 [Mortierella alpina]|nr:hypothetical protein BGZ68_010295 [Mortierella alpina]
MTDNCLTLFCLVDGEATSNAFPVEIESIKTVGHLKDLIKAKKANNFHDVDADDLTLWQVSIPDDDDDDLPVVLNSVPEKKKLKATTKLLKVYDIELPDDTIHIIVQRPPQVQAPVPIRASTPLPGYLSDDSRPGTPLSGDLHVDIKKITDKFFAPGPIANFLDAFVRGEGALPVTTGPIRGLPRAWRRNYGKPSESRPSLLFLDLPDPAAPDSASRNLASTSILDMVKQNNRPLIPVFGVSGCGKTRAVIELLSQHWGFYFNASSDDWGSSDMLTLHSTVQSHLHGTRTSFIVDRQANNAFARKITLLLFLSRLFIFKHCLNVSGSSETFTSARWMLLQVCPHVLFKDVFNSLFRQLLTLRHHSEGDLSDLIRTVFEITRLDVIRHGGLPNIKDDTRLLVVHDEAQFLGDEFRDSFQSMSSSDETPRPLLSPILHAFRNIGDDQLTLVTCGTGLSVNTLFWVQSSGSGLKDNSTNFEHIEFPGWTSLDSIKAYVSRVRRCLLDDESRRAFDERLPQDALDMLFDKFVGRYRPAIVALEKIMELSEHGTWRALIEDTEDRLVSWEHRTIKGNLCHELNRLHQKHKGVRRDKSVKSVLDILGFYFYRRCFWGENTLEIDSVNAALVERAFGRIKIVNHNAVTVVDEPFVFKAVENFFTATDPGFQVALKELMDRTGAASQGNIFEQYMMSVFSETFKSRRLSDWPHQPPISEMCPDLVGDVEIVGWKEPALLKGTTHESMSLGEFMNAHVKHQSTRKNTPVPPFFFPKSKPSGPDLVFFIRIDGCRIVPVFVQMKLRDSSAKLYNKLWKKALATVSAPCIQDHADDFLKYCPDNIYISMVVAYPMVCGPRLPPVVEVPEKDASGVLQVVIRVSDVNFGQIFPKEHVMFIDRLKNAGKRAADDVDSDNDEDDEDRSKKPRT